MIYSILVLAACRTPIPPEESPPRYAVLTPEGILVVDGDNVRQPVPGTGEIDTFAWAAGGRGFLATEGGALLLIGLDGERRMLSESWFAIRFPAASPDGKSIAVGARRKRGDPWGVWVLRSDGSRPRRLVDGYDPSWSADGTRLYFERFKPNQGLSVLDLGSSEARPFLDDGRRAFTVTCSRSGRLVAFTRGRALALYESSKSSVRELTHHRSYNRFPSFSPGERYLLFFREDPTGETHPERAIILLDLKTETETILDHQTTQAIFAP
ncbi:MAG: TolB family protein [Planctomycetota bacterium]